MFEGFFLKKQIAQFIFEHIQTSIPSEKFHFYECLEKCA